MRMVLLALLPTLTHADQLIEGDLIRVYFDDIGVWNDGDEGAGLQAYLGGDWVEFTYPGSPFNQWRLAWTDDTTTQEYYAKSSSDWVTNATVLDEADNSTSTMLASSYSYDAGDVSIRRTDSWAVDGQVMLVHFLVVNNSSDALPDMRLLFSVDPDQDALDGGYTTLNDVRDADGDGADDYVESVGGTSGYAIGFGACDPVNSELGHYGSWQGEHTADVTLSDSDGAAGDTAMAIRMTLDDDLAAGAAAEFALLVTIGETDADAETLWGDSAGDMCLVCDDDGDGYLHEDCGGSDCDDSAAEAHPGGTEVWYDGIDGDCDGGSDYDQDGDGHDSDGFGGTDCDDEDADINPDVEDIPYDGEDTDCSGGSDYDLDGDGHDSAGHGGDDCDDSDPTVSPSADEVWYDGTDQDCDGESDYDADGDGHDSIDHEGDDCDDFNSAAYPGAEEIGGDNVDQDCDGEDAEADTDTDTNDPGDDTDIGADKGGCSCSTPASGGPVGMLVLLLSGLALVRRRSA
jgi:MYXO-CTERM domain-containing protein